MEKFKQHNIKATPQRLAIYNLLINTKSHPSADMLYKSLHDRYPTMSLATVYKTIDILKKADLVQELVDDAFVTRYDANTHPHPHIICLSCNRIDDLNIDIPTDDTILKAASNATDYSIEFIRLYFYGYCSNCQNRMKNK